MSRNAELNRKTAETEISAALVLEGSGNCKVETGIAFLDHMVSALCKHGRFDLQLQAKGDLQVDDHHTAEDCALVLGSCFDQALSERKGITRFGYAYAPLDEALARAVVDLSGRSCAVVDLGLTRDSLGTLSCENIPHFFRSLATTIRGAVHVDVLRGENDHHRAEAAFKALGLALKQAVSIGEFNDIPSTKGTL